MKIIIDLAEAKPNKGDELRFNGEKWVPVSHNASFDSERIRIAELEEKVASLEKTLSEALEANDRKIAAIAKAVEGLL